MASSENSSEPLDPKQIRRLLRNLRESLGIIAEWTDNLQEGAYETVHIQLNSLLLSEDAVELRLRTEVMKQIEALPGSAPTVPLNVMVMS